MFAFAVHLSASGSTATICSSVNRLFFIGSLSRCGNHSLNSETVLKIWAGQCRLMFNAGELGKHEIGA